MSCLTKKAASFLLVFALVLSLLPFSAFAASHTIQITASGVENYDSTVVSTITIKGGNSKIGAGTTKEKLTTYIITLESSDADTTTLINSTGIKSLNLNFLCYIAESQKGKVVALTTKGKDLSSYSTSSKKEILAAAPSLESSLKAESTAFYYIYCNFGTMNIEGGEDFALLIQLIPPAQKDTDKTALTAAIEKVTGDNAANWHQSNDRYNGKETSTDGFWADMQPALENAQGALTDTTADETSVSNTTLALETAISKLIPINQVNATALYELLEAEKQTYQSGGDTYTSVTWASYKSAYEAADTFLKSLFYQTGDEIPEGKATGDATAKNDLTINTTLAADAGSAITLLTAAKEDLLATSYLKTWPLWTGLADWIMSKTDLTDASFTTASWSAWKTAYEALAEEYATEPDTYSEVAAYKSAVVDACSAFYALEDSKDSITVHVRVADNYGAAYPQWALDDASSAAFDGNVTLTDNQTVGGLITAMSLDESWGANSTTRPSGKTVSAVWCLYINGDLYVQHSTGDYDSLDSGFFIKFSSANGALGVNLHDGDSVVLVRTDMPVYDNYGTYMGYTSLNAYKEYYTYMGLLGIQGDDVLTVEAGKAFSLTVQKTQGAVEISPRRAQAASGVTLFLSDVAASQEAAAALPAYTSTGTVTDSSGVAESTIYAEGWYKLFVADVREATPGVSSSSTNPSGGVFPMLMGGDHILVHVTESSNSTAVRAEMQAELDEVYGQYGADFYGDQWETAKAAYEAASAIIAGENAEKPLLGDAYEAKETTVAQIQEIIDEISGENESKVSTVTTILNLLPTVEQINSNQFTQGYSKRYWALIDNYNALTEYQKNMLTGAQALQIAALQTAWGSDGSGLPAAVRPTVTVNVVAAEGVQDKFLLGEQIWYSIGDGTRDADESYSDYKANSFGSTTFRVLEGSSYSAVLGTAYGTSDTPIPDAILYEVYKAEIEGADGTVTLYDTPETLTASSGYIVVVDDYLNRRLSANEALISIPFMPTSNVTITLYIRATTDEKSLDEMKEDAAEELAEAYQSYTKSSYTDAGWTTLTEAYNSGLANIAAAEDESAMKTALENAKTAMAAVETRTQQTPVEGEGELGTVSIVVENTTYSSADSKLKGQFVKMDVPLDEDSTMMSCILYALEQNGYGWTGTGSGDKYAITYIASIFYDTDGDGEYDEGEPKLEEFDGTNTSGWMGVLNDWFTNEGFASFTVDASNRDYRIVDGDEIRIMFTLQGYGGDLGGSWGNSDTSLKALEVTKGGTLSPAFDGSQTEYVLILNNNASSVALTPTAANKNYQVKTFLNKKVTTAGVDYYRRGESITVKSGDVIYIGVGEYSWLSMNNQGAEAIPYSGTWYTITVVGAANTDSVISLIANLPTITYANYAAQSGNVSAARAAYNALSSSAKGDVSNYDKLTAAEEAITFYSEIDNVKSLLNAIPTADKLTKSDKSKVEAAQTAYNKLSDEQKLYITLADVAKYNAAVEWLKEQGVSTSAGTITKNSNEEAASEVIALIEAIGTVTKDSGDKITAARKAYDALTDAQKKLVSNYSILTEAEATFAELNSGLAFTDVKESDYFYEAVKWAVEQGITNGTTDTTFSPNAGCTRAQMVTFLWRAAGSPEPVGKTNAFTDVKEDAYYFKALLWAIENGITNGTTETTFSPDAACTRAQMAAFLYRSAKTPEVAGETSFTDVSDGAYYSSAVVWAAQEGITNGTGDGTTFSPDATCTRGQMVTFLYRYLAD